MNRKGKREVTVVKWFSKNFFEVNGEWRGKKEGRQS